MDGYKDGDRRRSDALEVTRPLVRGSRGPLRKTPPATCHAALIGNCQCETGNTFTLATFTTPLRSAQSKSRYLTHRSITPLNFTLFLRYHPRSSKRGCPFPKLIKLCLSHEFPEADPRPFGKHCKAGQTRFAMFELALMAMRLLP